MPGTKEVAVVVADHLKALISEAAADEDSPLHGVRVYFGAPTGDNIPNKHIVIGEAPDGLREDREHKGLGRRASGNVSYASTFEVRVSCYALKASSGTADLRPGVDSALELSGAIEDLVHKDNLEEIGTPITQNWIVSRTQLVPWATDELVGWRRPLTISGQARID